MEAWVTSATEDAEVINALVLAESLRKVKTQRHIAVITSRKVSTGNRNALREAFNLVLNLDEDPCHGFQSLSEEFQAKLFIFSLTFLKKCVFLSANSLVLENVDMLFEDNVDFQGYGNYLDDSLDLSIFVLSPKKELRNNLLASIQHNGKNICEEYLGKWLKRCGSMKMDFRLENIVSRFCLKSGTLMTDMTHTPIIQFANGSTGKGLLSHIESLKMQNIGLPEQQIMNAWLEIYHKNVHGLLNGQSHACFMIPENSKLDEYRNEPIAIVGMSCRYPGANNLEEFWDMLYRGEEGIREPPAFRWTKEHSLRVSPQERKTHAGFLSTTVDEFDARFFGLSPKEASYMDPQTRLLHEVLWESLEDSSIDPLSLHGTHAGVFVGSWMNDYKDIVDVSSEQDFFRTYMGNGIGAAAARLSFLLGLTGPSIATESGCSSAIVALDLAVKSLRRGESNLAMAAGVNLLLHPFTTNMMDFVISPNGRCKTFDSKADGFGRAEGCGVLVLKRMSDALRDRDNIWALIRGSAISQEGLSRSIGTPTVHSEALAMQLALQDANVKPCQVSFVETHGTGTAVGDPMEVAAIAKAYYSSDRVEPLIIGSVKTNVGHTESCSGITGIMKTVLAMQHELIPKHLNFETLNPEIFLDSIPAIIPLEAVEWPKVDGQPRIAGVSSFGITGTDGHVIIEEAPDFEFPKFTLGLERPTHIMKISGKSSQALDQLLEQHGTLLSERAEKGDDSFANAAYSANIGRATFNHRAFIVGNNYQDAVKLIQGDKVLRCEVKEGDSRKICFLFTGQGSQYQGMAKALYDTSPIFRINFDACDRVLRKLYNLSIRQVLWESDPSSKELSRTIYSQTSIFCVEYCLLKLWQSWGIQPDFVLGHSLGEFAAAVAAGILDFEGALKLVAERSRLIDNLPRGSMLVIKASKQEVDKLMKSGDADLDIAAVNNSEQTVVAGDMEKIQSFFEYLREHGLKAIILEATHAFHSRHMEPMLEEYRKIANTVTYKPGNPNVQYVSGMEGKIIWDSSEINSDYWVRHTREKVSFVDACAALHEATDVIDYLELGPQPVLSSFVMLNNEVGQIICLSSLRRRQDDWETMLSSLGTLYLLGYQVNWKGFDEPYRRNKVSLPFNPFQRKSYWVEYNSRQMSQIHPLLGCNLNNPSPLSIFKNDLSLNSVSYLKDHRIGNRIIFPGAGYIEMFLSAGNCVANGLYDSMESPGRAIRVENIIIDAPLELKEGESCHLQVVVDLPELALDDHQNHGFRLKVFHQNTSSEDLGGKWILHSSSTFQPVVSTKDIMKKWDPSRIQQILSEGHSTPANEFYRRVDTTGIKFGDTFKSIGRHWALQGTILNNEGDVVAEVTVPPDHDKYLLHPVIIDALFQTCILTLDSHVNRPKIPIRVGQLTLLRCIDAATEKSPLYSYAWRENDTLHCFLFTKELVPIAYVEDLELIETNVRTIESVLELQSNSLPDAWKEIWGIVPGPFTNLTELAPIAPIFSENEFQVKVKTLRETTPETLNLIKAQDQLLYSYVLNAIYALGWTPQVDDTFTLEQFREKLKILPRFRQLVHFYLTVFAEEQILTYNASTNLYTITHLPPPLSKIQLNIKELANEFQETLWKPAMLVHENIAGLLHKILRGEETALSILFPTDEDKQQFSAEQFYQHYPGRTSTLAVTTHIIKSVLKLQHSVNDLEPQRVYRVLEVGAGTGNLSRIVLELLRERWSDKFEYYFTDISPSFFGKAAKQFEIYSGNLKFVVFDAEKSGLEQGIPLNYFDLVICLEVLHATRSIQESLVHIRQTMRPKATLYFTETLIAARDITFIFGLLDGYWRFQDFHWRPHHACTNENVWTEVLTKSGFHSVSITKTHGEQFGCITAEASADITLTSLTANQCPAQDIEPNKNDECRYWVVFIASTDIATHEVANMIYASGANVVAVIKSCADEEDEIASISEARKKLDKNISIVAMRGESSRADIHALFETKSQVHGIFYGWGMDTVETRQACVAMPLLHIIKWMVSQRKAPALYILTQGVHPINESLTVNPTPATLFGMAKSLKNENDELFVRYIDLQHGSLDLEEVTDQILFELAMSKGSKEGSRVQIAYRDNKRYEPKFVKTAISAKRDELQLPPSSERYQLVLPESRQVQDLEFGDLEIEDVKENEVEIRVHAFALNFKDILTILKPSAEFEQLNTVGLDFAGVVSRVGSEVLSTGQYKVGDRVFGANFKEAQLPSHLVLEASSILGIPDKMTFWEACTLPAVFATAYHCLINIAKMKKGDTVLIHTGSGGVGLAAIQLAKQVGATVITTAGSARKRAYLRGIGVEHVFHSRNTSYENDIMRVTDGRGVDVVLNSITGPGMKEATLAACAKQARFVEMSKLSIWTTEEVYDRRPDVDYTIVDLTVLRKEVWGKLLESLAESLKQGWLQPLPFVKYDALHIRQALQFFQKAKHIGKLVCVIPQVIPQDGIFRTQISLFNSESTYLITGGLKGIGFEVCKWMLEKGATDIVLAGRSPPTSDVNAVIGELREKRGFNITTRQFDVSDFDQCKAAIHDICQNGKPLRGVMHCAGVLSDNLYAKQTWEAFEATFQSKVEGTWNLHNLTKELPLEHFVFYSSFVALMGTTSQSNHAAANCFEDAFAHYRHSMGLPATSINWGQWGQVGCAKDINITGIIPVSFKKMLNGLEVVINSNQLQICLSKFDSFQILALLIPTAKSYLDESLWKKAITSNQQENQTLNTEMFWSEMDGSESKEEKLAIVGKYLKCILRAALRLEAYEVVSDVARLQDLGVDSLMRIELKNSIQTLMGSRLVTNASLMKDRNTVRQLATSIVNKIVDNTENEGAAEPFSIEELKQLLNNDSKLDDNIQCPSLTTTKDTIKSSRIQTVFVTGATGQIGGYLISELSTNYKQIVKIICLVRNVEGTTPQKRFVAGLKSMNLTSTVDINKLEFVAGDVTLANFGLDEKVYDTLCESVDAVIHCAGKSNYSEPYTNYETSKVNDVRSVHVQGTVNILKFASTKIRKQIYSLSTFACGAFGKTDNGALSSDWPESDVMQACVDAKLPGYQISKLVCELLLKEANLRGIPCKVFRLPWIAGNSCTGQLDCLNNLYILRYLSFLKVNGMPSFPIPANVLPIDFCAKLSLQLFFNEEAPFEVFNLGHPNPQLEQEFLRVAKQDFTKELEILEWAEFSERLQKKDSQMEGLNDLHKDQMNMSMLVADGVRIFQEYIESLDTFFRNDKVSRFIPDWERNIEPSMEIVRRDLLYLKSLGFLDKFGI